MAANLTNLVGSVQPLQDEALQNPFFSRFARPGDVSPAMHALGSEMLSRDFGVMPSLAFGVGKELADEYKKRQYPDAPTAGFSKEDLQADIYGALAGKLPISLRNYKLVVDALKRR